MEQTVQMVEPDISTLPKRSGVGNGKYGLYLASVNRSNGKMSPERYLGKHFPKGESPATLLSSPEQALVYHSYDSELKVRTWQLVEVGKE